MSIATASIVALANQAVNTARTAIQQAHKAGELLIDAKAKVKYGAWGTWVKENCICSERTAQKYMRLAKAPLTADLTGRRLYAGLMAVT